MIIEFKVFFFLNTAILSMCDYYAFACRFQCLPETHHFSPNWISYIIAYIWLITNDGNPSRYEHRVNYSKKFIFISILSHIMILQRWFLPKKQREKILQKKKKKRKKSTRRRPVSHSHYMWKVNIFTVELIKFTSLPTLPPAPPVWSSLRNAIRLRHPGPQCSSVA